MLRSKEVPLRGIQGLGSGATDPLKIVSNNGEPNGK